MADNRLFLVHRPTGAVLFLGKRLGINWHHDEPLDIDAFYRQCAAEGWGGNEDDFVLAMEDASRAPGCNDRWKYTPGPGRLNLKRA